MTRICSECKLDWNVSRLAPPDRRYICPKCEYKRRQKEKEKKHERI